MGGYKSEIVPSPLPADGSWYKHQSGENYEREKWGLKMWVTERTTPLGGPWQLWMGYATGPLGYVYSTPSRASALWLGDQIGAEEHRVVEATKRAAELRAAQKRAFNKKTRGRPKKPVSAPVSPAEGESGVNLYHPIRERRARQWRAELLMWDCPLTPIEFFEVEEKV